MTGRIHIKFMIVVALEWGVGVPVCAPVCALRSDGLMGMFLPVSISPPLN